MAWLSLLFCEASVIYDTAAGEELAYYVVNVNSHGALLWSGHAEGALGLRIFRLRSDGRPWKQLTILSSTADWRVRAVSTKSPSHAEVSYGLPQHGVMWLCSFSAPSCSALLLA